MGFWEWAGTSDATAVITGIFGTGGLGGVVLLIARHFLKDKPDKTEQIKAVEAVAAPTPDRDALWIARQALQTAAEASEKVDKVTAINNVQGAWIRDIRGRWHIVRQSETPPPPPDTTNI